MRRFLVVSLASFGLTISACDGCPGVVASGIDGGSPSPEDGGASGLADASSPGGDGGATNADGGDAGGSEQNLTLVIEPEDAMLEATVGGSETLQLSAVLVDEDGGRTLAAVAYWASLDPEIGTVDSTGLFTPTRERAGVARVRARAEGVEGIGEVRVVLHEEVSLQGSVGPGDFDGPEGQGPGPSVLYPESGVVIPSNLAPMLFQWDKVKTRARVLLEGDAGSLTLYTDGDRAEAPILAWRRFLLAHTGRSFTVTVEESDGPGSERVKTTITVHLADADLTSTVYYWAVNLGRIVRIDADSLAPMLLEIPYEDVANGGVPGGAGQQQCRACHTLSADGQRMAFTYFGGNGPGGVVDTAQLAPPLLPNRDDRRWNFAALSPDGSLLVTNYQRRLTLRDGLTGEILDADLTGFDAAHPAFSPAGDRIAFAGEILLGGGPPGWEIDFSSSNLYIADVDPATRTVGDPRQIVPGDGEALYYPSFSPDGKLVAFTKGPHSRSRNGGVNLRGNLFLADADADPGASGSVPTVELLRANPGQNAYLPTFNPKVEGGYMWIAFFSRRDFGHITRGTERPQIWVAAIDEDADPSTGEDPSHPAFWLPGQDPTTDNLSSFFAPRPCAPAGGSCDTDAACCGELLCRPEGGDYTCVPPEEACALTSDPCESDDACCEGLICADAPGGGRACLPPGEVCSERGQLCELDADCCEGAGLCLDDGTGQTRCLTEDDLPCGEEGQSCVDRPCCEGAGMCLDGICVIIDG